MFIFVCGHVFRLRMCVCARCVLLCVCVRPAAEGFNQEEEEIDGRPVIEAVAG